MKKTVFAASFASIVIAVCLIVSFFFMRDGLFGAQNGTYNEASSNSPAVFFDYSLSNKSLNKSEYYNYQNLTDTQKIMYDKMYEAVSVMKVGNIELCKGEKRDIALALYALKYDNPHLFWIGYEYGVGEADDEKMFIRFDDGKGESKYLFTHIERVEMMNKLQNKVKNILNEYITDEMSDYDKELAIHDWLCNNVEYDKTAGESATKDERINENKSAWTAYGAIVEKSAVCEGYSKAFQLLMYCAGINSNVVCGEASDGAAHMWNTVLIDGEWYNVDVLWDDVENPQYGITHSFFNVTTDFIKKTHTVFSNSDKIKNDDDIFSAEYNLKIPECNSDKMNFYVVNNTLIKSDEEYKSVVENALKTASINDVDTVEFFYDYKEINENIVSYDIKTNGVFSIAKKYYKDIKGVRCEANSHGSFKINISR